MITIPVKDDPTWHSFKLLIENSRPKSLIESVEICSFPSLDRLELISFEMHVSGIRNAYAEYPLAIASCVSVTNRSDGDVSRFDKAWFSEDSKLSWDEVYPIIEKLTEGAIAEFREEFIALHDDLVRLLGVGVRQGEQEQ